MATATYRATHRLAAAAIGIAVIGFALPASAQSAENVRHGRTAAIHDCTSMEQKYSEPTWGLQETDQYRACMARHGQQE